MTSQMYMKGDFVRDGDQLVSISAGDRISRKDASKCNRRKADSQVWLVTAGTSRERLTSAPGGDVSERERAGFGVLPRFSWVTSGKLSFKCPQTSIPHLKNGDSISTGSLGFLRKDKHLKRLLAIWHIVTNRIDSSAQSLGLEVLFYKVSLCRSYHQWKRLIHWVYNEGCFQKTPESV